MSKTERVLGCIYIPIHGFVLPVVLGVLIGLYAPQTRAPYQMLIFSTVSFAITLVIMFKFLRTSFSDLIDGFWRAVQSIILGYVLYRALLWITALLIARLMSGVNPNTEAFSSALSENNKIMIIVSVVLAPIIEETVFRGALFGTIRQKSRIAAYVISILIFALFHLLEYVLAGYGWQVLLFAIQYVPASVALTWCYERGGTIWAPILLHAILNLIVCIS